jgi:hypothetical protein
VIRKGVIDYRGGELEAWEVDGEWTVRLGELEASSRYLDLALATLLDDPEGDTGSPRGCCWRSWLRPAGRCRPAPGPRGLMRNSAGLRPRQTRRPARSAAPAAATAFHINP